MLGFTRNETRILLFLIFGFFIGLGVWMVRNYWIPLPVIAEEESRSTDTVKYRRDIQSSEFEENKRPLIQKVILNSASQKELESLPGIGPITARRIILYREQNGRFQAIQELMNIKGIGEKTIQKLSNYLILN